MIAAAGEPGGEAVRAILQQADSRLHALRRMSVHARPAVQYAVDGGKADAGRAGDILKGGTRHGISFKG
jgi:hypothetical protein